MSRYTEGPWTTILATAASNTTVLSPPTTAIYVGNTGNVSVRMAMTQSNAVFVVPGGTTLRIVADKIYTDTTATNWAALA